jgi:hypothetical protein
MRDPKTIKKHATNQVTAETTKSSYAAQWQDQYTQAKQRCEESDEGDPGLEGALSESGRSTQEGLQRPVKRRRINEGVVSLIIFNENILFCTSHCQYSTK